MKYDGVRCVEKFKEVGKKSTQAYGQKYNRWKYNLNNQKNNTIENNKN